MEVNGKWPIVVVHKADVAFEGLLSSTKFTGESETKEVNLRINDILAIERNYWRFPLGV